MLIPSGLAWADVVGPWMNRTCVVDIDGESFLVNRQPTYRGRAYNGRKIEGLLLNARLVQGIFDDENAQTRPMWRTPDGKDFDADDNTNHFIAAMPEWRKLGLISFTINFQGGSPQGYSKDQPWINSAFEPDGELKPAYMERMSKILDRADQLQMVPIVGLFYFGQTKVFRDEAAVIAATDHAVDYLLGRGYANVLIEIANECDSSRYPAIIQPDRADELIRRVQERSAGKARNAAKRFYVSTSLRGGKLPNDKILGCADFVLLHGNGVGSPDGIRQMVRQTRASASYRGQPILFNEDDHFDFDKPDNNFLAALDGRAGWGYFDYRMAGESFHDGFQSVPVDWSISSPRKRAFFGLLRAVTGSP